MSSLLIGKNLIRFSTVYEFADDVCRLLNNEELKRLLLIPKLQILDQVLKEQKIDPAVLPHDLQQKIKEIAKGQERKIEEYPLVVINQSWVILWSIFESYLISSLEAILDTKPEVIIALSEQKAVTLEEIIRLKDYDSVLANFKNKIIRGFFWASIRDRFNRYFKPLGFNISEFFDMSHYIEKVQTTYTGWGLDKLSELYDERNSIVHKEGMPLKSLPDLHYRKEFFVKISINITRKISEKFGITNDLSPLLGIEGLTPRGAAPKSSGKA